MNRNGLVLLILAPLMLCGCSGDRPSGDLESKLPAEPELVRPLDLEDPTILRRPFTAEQIRDEWVEGFWVKWGRGTPGGEVLERWTVLSADDQGAEIRFAVIDENGGEVGEPTTARSTWEALRNHATFPAEFSRVEEATRETALGWLDGRLYTVRDDETNTVTEYFFVGALPGAPVEMRTTLNGELVEELRQLERGRTVDP